MCVFKFLIDNRAKILSACLHMYMYMCIHVVHACVLLCIKMYIFSRVQTCSVSRSYCSILVQLDVT